MYYDNDNYNNYDHSNNDNKNNNNKCLLLCVGVPTSVGGYVLAPMLNFKNSSVW